MRRVLMGDLIALARFLAARPQTQRQAAAARVIYETHLADKCTKKLRQLHPDFGNGSLMVRCFAEAPLYAPVGPGDPRFCEGLLAALIALQAWRARQASYNLGT